MRSLTAYLASLAIGATVLLASGAKADVLVSTHGERFVGQVIGETPDTVIFQSELGGKLTVPRSQIREIQKASPPPQSSPATQPIVEQSSTTKKWRPPAIGHDDFDWLRLTSDEWLKGHLYYVQERKVSFESDKLEDLDLKLKDVSQLYTAEPVQVRFEGAKKVIGKVWMDDDLVHVYGADQLTLQRDELLGIAPGGEEFLSLWSGKFTLGYSVQSGNTDAQSLNVNTELYRRTPSQAFELSYLGDYSQVNNTIDANDHRVNALWDARLNHKWFVRVAQAEYYRDPIANISSRVTASVGIGYNFYNRDDLNWYISAGPAYQYTQFVTVEDGDAGDAKSLAARLASAFKMDLTSRTNIKLSYEGIFTDERAGRYSHHALSTLEFKITHVVILDVSFIWDFLDHPQIRSNGNVPDQSDLRLNVGIGLQF